MATGLRELREKAGLTLRDVSSLCGGPAGGFARSTIQALEQGDLKDKEKAALVERRLRGLQEKDFVTMQRVKLPGETCKFFGLRRDPFAEPRDWVDVYQNDDLNAVYKRLEDAVKFQDFIALMGQIGSGKTLLKTRLESASEQQSHWRLLQPRTEDMSRLTAGSIAAYILRSFDVHVPRELTQRSEALRHLLKNLHDDGIRPALVIDECHRLNDRALTALKNFFEIGRGFTRFLGVILIGQPQFAGRLQSANFQEILERIEQVQMPPVRKWGPLYLSHRITAVGGNPTEIFPKATMDKLCGVVDTPLALGNRAAEALLIAHQQYNERVVRPEFLPETRRKM